MTSLLGMQQSAAKRHHSVVSAGSPIDFWRSELQKNMRPLRPLKQETKRVQPRRFCKPREHLSDAYNFLNSIIVRWWESDTRYFEGTVLELAYHYKKTQIICPLCRTDFCVSGVLYRHLANVHRQRTGVSSYPCQHCKVLYRHQKALKAHGDCSQRFPQLEVVGELDKSARVRDEGENSYTVFRNSLAAAARLDDFVSEESQEGQEALDSDPTVLAAVAQALCPNDNETGSDIDLCCSESPLGSDSDYETN